MSRFARTPVRLGLAAATATGLVAAGITGAQAAAHRPAAVQGAVLKATIDSGQLTLNGDTTFPAGRLYLTLKAVGKESELAVVNLHAGFTFKELRSDIRTFGESFDKQGNPSKAGLRALNLAINHA
jgi:hypothetical protein